MVCFRYKIAAESSHSKNEKKGKKRANSGSRDKDKTTRRSKVGTASNANHLIMDDSEDEAGPSGAISINGAVDFNELHGLHGDYPLDDSDGPDVLAHFDDGFAQGFPSSPNKKGVTTRSGWTLGKSPKPKPWSTSPKGASGSSGKASTSATKSSSSATKSSSSGKTATASATKASASSAKASGSALKATVSAPSKVAASMKNPASTSKPAACFLTKPSASTSKNPGAVVNLDGPSGGISGLHFGPYKLKLFPGKHDPKKGGPSTSGTSSNNAAKGN